MRATSEDFVRMRQLAMELVSRHPNDVEEIQHLAESHGEDLLRALVYMARTYRNNVNGDVSKAVAAG